MRDSLLLVKINLQVAELVVQRTNGVLASRIGILLKDRAQLVEEVDIDIRSG
jgi:hypothetical protein